MVKLLAFWADISKEVQRRIVSTIIFALGLIILFIGISLFPSPFAIPFIILGVVSVIIGGFSLGVCLVEWWD